MVRPLRRAHLRIWIALAILLPCLLLASVMARRTTTPANAEIRWDDAR